MSAWTQESLDRVLAVNKNRRGEWNDVTLTFFFLDIEGENLPDLDLSGIMLFKCNLRKTRFDRSILNQLIVQYSDCRGAHFDGATLNRARFEYFSFLDGASFFDTDLDKAYLEIPQDVNLIDANIGTAKTILCVSYEEIHKRVTEYHLPKTDIVGQYEHFLLNMTEDKLHW